MMQEKVKQIQEASQLDPSLAVVEPPSPLKRHEKWKRARQKKSGDYINEDARIIAEKIVSKYSILHVIKLMFAQSYTCF